jgi:3-hydroxyisobutyrate dehydrogenase
MAKVAFIGLGVMGFPMAGHLATKGGHEVTVYNRNAAKAKAWVEKFGGKSAPTPKAAAEGQDFVMCCVGNDDDLRSVTIGADGAFSGMTKGAIFVDHTTASAEVARELDAAATKAGFQFIDAPVSGGQAGAENGALTVMCGGTQAAYAKVEPIITAYAKMQKLLGPAGSGHQDGQPDLHRRPCRGTVRRHSLRQEGRSRRQCGGRGDLQGRRAVVADGESSQDHE